MSKVGRYEQLQTVAKLLNSEPKVLVDFFVDVGIEVLSRTQLHLLKEFHAHLDEFIKKIETPTAGTNLKNQISLLDEIKSNE